MNTTRAQLVLAMLLGTLVAAGCRDAGERTPVREDVAARLSGQWDVSMRLERPLALTTEGSALQRTVAGTITLVMSRDAAARFAQMPAPTHVGVHAIDLALFGMPHRPPGYVPSVAARLAGNAGGQDSVYLLLDPETPTQSVHLAGVLNASEIRGSWVAESFLGGGGSFTMRRRATTAP